VAVFSIKSFGGIAPIVPARYLQDNQAQTALNCPVFQGSIQTLTDVGAKVADLQKTGTIQSIYRFGQDSVSENNYWFHWNSDVDVCRSQIAGDVSEWTFFTGDGGPKATYNSLALSGTNYPTATRPLGLPAPSTPISASVNAGTATSHPATVTLTASHVASLTTANNMLISTVADNANDYQTVSLSGTITSTSVTAAINAVSNLDVTATEQSGNVEINTTATGPTAKLFVKFQTGTEPNTDGTFIDGSLNLSATGAAYYTGPYVVIDDSEISAIESGQRFTVSHANSPYYAMYNVTYTFTGTLTAAAFATFLDSNLSGLNATQYGSCVVITPGTAGLGPNNRISYRRMASNNMTNLSSIPTSYASNSDSPARLFVTQANVDAMENQYLKITVNGTSNIFPVVNQAYVSLFNSYTYLGIGVQTFGSIEPFAVIETTAVGANATLSIKNGDYPDQPIFTLLQSVGSTDESSTVETRVYTYTNVNKESGFEFESAPAEASNSVDVKLGQTVSLSGFSSIPSSYIVSHRRIYRSVSGTFLFVKEIASSAASFTDNVKAEDLAEELPSLTWSEPPQTLSGLINLPNGIMAGFTGRDIHFCDPYHPHAWPENYIQTVDFPVVGFGRMDTTLAVLTKGTPYLVQGSHPANMTIVKSELEQACVSKRSIVSLMGGVVYAAPDGLMLLSPGGSRIVTENLFDFSQWQAFFKPESIHAYQQDNQYIAFYNNGTQSGGFIFDVRSGQFILHDIYADSAYHDLLLDKLFVVVDDSGNKVKPFSGGAEKNYTWKSKKFTMPQIMGFSCAQLEAEAYPMTVKFYADNALVHTQTVQNRDPFRLPSKVGRDWEMQIEGSKEVFSLSIANSMSELASG